MEEGQRRRSGNFGRKLVIILLLLLFVTLGVCGLLFVKYKQAVETKTLSERQQILQKIEAVIVLPDEQPDLSTVLDTSKLTNATLQKRAQDGDKLLVYDKAKRLIIYRPSVGKVVDMLTIQSDTTGRQTTD